MQPIRISGVEELGAELRARAEAAELTQAQLARMAGIDRTEVAKVYAGVYKRHKHYAAVASALGTTLEAISRTLQGSPTPDIAPPAHIIAISSLKGGSGKTTTSVHLAAGLARRGYRVLFLDLDSSCQSQGWLTDGVDHLDSEAPNIFDVLARNEIDGRRVEIMDTIYPSFVEGLDLARSTREIEELDNKLHSKAGKEHRLKHALKPVLASYDFIVFDTAPDNDVCLHNALMAADSMLIPIKPTDTDLDRFFMFIPELLHFVYEDYLNPDLRLLGILVGEVESIGEFEREFMRTLDEEFPGSVFSTTISRYKDYGRLLSNKQLIYTRDRAKATDNGMAKGGRKRQPLVVPARGAEGRPRPVADPDSPFAKLKELRLS